jgi:tight adherence protein C
MSLLAQGASWLAQLLLFVAVALLSYALLGQTSSEAPRLGIKGLKRARTMAEQGLFASFDPLLRWLSARLGVLVPSSTRVELEQNLTMAGDLWGITADELVALTLLSGVAGLGLGFVYGALTKGGFLFTAVFAVLGTMAPRLYVSGVGRERVRRIQRALPHSVDLLVLALGAGLDFPAALRQLVEKASDPSSPVVEELGLVLQELQLGRTRQQAVEQLARRVPCDTVRDLVAAAIQSEEQGTPLGFVLQMQAMTARQRRSTQAEESAAKAGAAMIVPMVLLFFAIMILIGGPIVIEAGPQLRSL